MKTQSLLILLSLLYGMLSAQNVQMEGARVSIQDQAKVGNVITGTGNDIKITQHITQNVLPKSQEFTHLQAKVEALREILVDKNRALKDAISTGNSALETYIRRDRDERAAEYEDARQRLQLFREDVIRLAKTFEKIPIKSERLKEAKALFQRGNFSAADALLQRTQMGQETDGLLRKRDDLQKDLSSVDSLLEIQSIEWLIKAQITQTRSELMHRFDSVQYYLQRSLECSRGGENQFQYATLLQEHQQLDSALVFYEGAKKAYLAVGDSLAALFIQSNLAVIFQDQRRHAEAKEIYLELLQGRQRLKKTHAPFFLFDMAVLQNNLGNVYRAQREFAKAEAALLEALQIREALAKEGEAAYQSHLAVTHDNLGILYSQIGRLAEAESSFRKSLVIRSKLAEVDSSIYQADLATSQSNLGTLYRQQKKLTEAEASYLESLEIRSRLNQANPLAFAGDLAAIETNLGAVYLDQEKYEKAEAFLTQSLLRRRKLSENLPAVYEPLLATTQFNLGILFHRLQKYKQAEEAFKEALAIREKEIQDDPSRYQLDLANVLTSQGKLLFDTKRWKEAEVAYMRALETWEDLAAAEPAMYLGEMGKVANALGAIFDDGVGDREKAEIWYRKALETRRLWGKYVVRENELPLAQSAVVLASLLQEKEGLEAALPLFREALQISDRYSNQPLSVQISALVIKSIGIEQADPELATWERKSKNLEEAVRKEKVEVDQIVLQEVVLSHWQEAHQKNPDNPRIAERLAIVHGQLARLHLFTEEFQAAEDFARKGLQLKPNLPDAQAPLAIALLFQDRYQEVVPLLQACRDKRKSKFLSWGASLQFDIKKLEAKGITHPQLVEAKAILAGE